MRAVALRDAGSKHSQADYHASNFLVISISVLCRSGSVGHIFLGCEGGEPRLWLVYLEFVAGSYRDSDQS